MKYEEYKNGLIDVSFDTIYKDCFIEGSIKGFPIINDLFFDYVNEDAFSGNVTLIISAYQSFILVCINYENEYEIHIVKGFYSLLKLNIDDRIKEEIILNKNKIEEVNKCFESFLLFP